MSIIHRPEEQPVDCTCFYDPETGTWQGDWGEPVPIYEDGLVWVGSCPVHAKWTDSGELAWWLWPDVEGYEPDCDDDRDVVERDGVFFVLPQDAFFAKNGDEEGNDVIWPPLPDVRTKNNVHDKESNDE